MDEDALVVAREAVAATRMWREQMRADWGQFREPEEVLDEAVGELLAERDHLRAVVRKLACGDDGDHEFGPEERAAYDRALNEEGL